MRHDVLRSIRVCESCDSALAVPHRRFGSGRYANRCALVGALVAVAGWEVMGEPVSLLGAIAFGIAGAIIGGLVAWLVFPDLDAVQ